MSQPTERPRVALLIPVLAALLACSDGGANANQNAPGDQAGGIPVGLDDGVFGSASAFSGLGEIAVAPRDGYVVFAQGGALAVGYTDTGRVRSLPVEEPTRLAFSKQRKAVYVGSVAPSDQIVAIDVDSRTALWRTPIDEASTFRLRIASSEDDRRLVTADASTGEIAVLDARTGAVLRTHALGERIVDLRILPDDRRALAVLDETWSGTELSTRVVIFSLDDGSSIDLFVPNCADTIALSGDGATAFMAPTTCVEPSSSRAKDPISVIDLTPGAEAFVRNLPGFGPVAVSPSGTTAVGFLDTANIDAGLFDDPALIPDASTDRYHLMLLDTETLDYEFVEVGSTLPRFAITPSGSVLLVDSSWTVEVPARLFDVTAGAWRFIDGAPLMLDEFVITSDSTHAYVIESRFFEGLYDLDIAAGTSTEITLPFSPRNINIAPSDDTLYLRKSDEEICVFSLATRRCAVALSSADLVAN